MLLTELIKQLQALDTTREVKIRILKNALTSPTDEHTRFMILGVGIENRIVVIDATAI